MSNSEALGQRRGSAAVWDTMQSAISPQPKKSQLALQYLEELLKEIPPGGKLPSEREIATQLGITRSPVREALIALQMVGKIRIEAGVGAFALEDEAEAAKTSSAFSLLAESESPFEIRELREVLEARIVVAAIAELTSESLKTIEGAFNGMVEAHAAMDMDGFLEAHCDFHIAIAVASNNSLFERLARWMLVHVMTQPIWEMTMQRRLRETSSRIVDSIEEHRGILDAIRNKDSQLAESLMRNHFARVD